MQIKNNVFIVTGGASGLGEGTARMLARSLVDGSEMWLFVEFGYRLVAPRTGPPPAWTGTTPRTCSAGPTSFASQPRLDPRRPRRRRWRRVARPPETVLLD